MMRAWHCQRDRQFAEVRISSGEIHIWWANLDVQQEILELLGQTLSPDEQNRAARFHFVRDQQRFTVGRGLLRMILAGYLGYDAKQVQFVYGSHGKPALAAEWGGESYCFNLAHSASSFLLAVTCGREVGVDLEYIRPIPDSWDFAAQVFSPSELAALKATPVELQQDSFMRYWVRKEAYLKARGMGLLVSLPTVGIIPTAHGSNVMFDVEGEPDAEYSWSIRDLDTPPGFAAALAVEGCDWQLTYRRWPS
jgi:4'-phosphopantetheinyl transferase